MTPKQVEDLLECISACHHVLTFLQQCYSTCIYLMSQPCVTLLNTSAVVQW